ncbi:predicted protein [Plenodomus lingam JN3]|uniref:Predicted protein n=1 Tax=Leptosphaeria maculans (strain JN3 / isolate v23.1.3 / race Av1-4-5-6-7-8) TaxID=985895 RepID=E5R4J9_LEPMJ|nr:predicted protein [Plenodomus lingam JN3]CBX91967.1 predicted protein [Plenodomus lingam JN3]
MVVGGYEGEGVCMLEVERIYKLDYSIIEVFLVVAQITWCINASLWHASETAAFDLATAYIFLSCDRGSRGGGRGGGGGDRGGGRGGGGGDRGGGRGGVLYRSEGRRPSCRHVSKTTIGLASTYRQTRCEIKDIFLTQYVFDFDFLISHLLHNIRERHVDWTK